MTGIPLSGRKVDLEQLQGELVAAGVTVPALGIANDAVFTYDGGGNFVDLPPAATAIVTAHTPSTAVRDAVGAVLQSTVGVAITDLTNVQLIALVKGLIYKQGGFNRQGQIRPLNQWLT